MDAPDSFLSTQVDRMSFACKDYLYPTRFVIDTNQPLDIMKQQIHAFVCCCPPCKSYCKNIIIHPCVGHIVDLINKPLFRCHMGIPYLRIWYAEGISKGEWVISPPWHVLII